MVFGAALAGGLVSADVQAAETKHFQEHRDWVSLLIISDMEEPTARAGMFDQEKKTMFYADWANDETFTVQAQWRNLESKEADRTYPDIDAVIRVDGKRRFSVRVTPKLDHGTFFLDFHFGDQAAQFLKSVRAGNAMTIDYVEGGKVFRSERYSLAGASAAIGRAVELAPKLFKNYIIRPKE